jgi:hypothetical protein
MKPLLLTRRPGLTRRASLQEQYADSPHAPYHRYYT